MRRLLVGAMIILSTLSAYAEELAYSIYTVPLIGDKPTLVTEGRRVYALADVRVAKGPAPDIPNWTKTLTVFKEYEIGASVYRERRVEGFGLWISKSGAGFSWEWFNRGVGDTFAKLQGPGQVKVRFNKIDGLEEIAEIEFLGDITMRLNAGRFIPFVDKETDLLVVKKGSVLRLAP